MNFKKIQDMLDKEEKIIEMINVDNNILCIGDIEKSLLTKINQKSKILYLNSIKEKDIEIEQIIINQYDENIFQKEINFELFDVILLSESKEIMTNIKKLLINLKKYCKKEAKIIFIIKNFCSIYNRIEILNGELNSITNNSKNQHNQNIFNLKTINQLINNSGYCIQQIDRIEIEELTSEINYNKDYTISKELIDSIKTDPESLVSEYIIKIKNIENNTDEIRNWLSTFSNTIVTQRLKEWIEHYKEKSK